MKVPYRQAPVLFSLRHTLFEVNRMGIKLSNMFACKRQSKAYMNDFIRALSTSAVSADLAFLVPKKFLIEFFFFFPVDEIITTSD